MVEMNDLSGKIFSLLKGNGLQVKIFDETGAETTDPNSGRRFFVVKPNIMVTIDEDNNKVEFSKGSEVGDDVLGIQKNIRKLADQFMMNSQIKIFGRSIQPRDYAYQAKMKNASMMESRSKNPHSIESSAFEYFEECIKRGMSYKDAVYQTGLIMQNLYNLDSDSTSLLRRKILDNYKESEYSKKDSAMMENSVQPYNHQLVGQVLNKVKYFGNAAAYTIADDLGVGLDDVQPALNRLVKSGKIKATPNSHDEVEYSVSVEETVMESFSKMFGSQRTSQQTLENVRILVKHKTPVDENVRGARSRHISSIFLECNGERFRFPNTYLPGARAMAQHLAHGGAMTDKVGTYISESTENLLKLQSFNRYVTTNNLINEDSSGIVDTVKENIETIRTELRKITGVKTYETVRARLETFERQALEEDDVSGLKDLFTIRRFDEKFEGVLPIIKQLVQEKDTFHKRIEEAAANPVVVRREKINTTPMFEFSSENARLGFKINELALRIVENEELSEFVNKIGSKLCKEGQINDFEKAIFTQVLENIQVESISTRKEIKESTDLDSYFDKYTMNFF